MTPTGWQRVTAQRNRDREEFNREKRRDVRRYLIGLACVLVAFLGGLTWALHNIPTFGLGG